MRLHWSERLLLGTALLSMTLPFSSFAGTISKITLDISSDIQAGESGGDVDVSVSTDGCYVDSVEFMKEPSRWQAGDEPTIRVVLSLEEDSIFDSDISEKDITVKGDGNSVTSVTHNKDEITVYIQLDAVTGEAVNEKLSLSESSGNAAVDPGEAAVEASREEDEDEDEGNSSYNLDVSGLEWDKDTGTAYWDKVSDAREYEVRLYRDGDSVTSVKTTSRTSYDFYEEFTRSGDYSFRVRAVRSSSKGSWEESEEWYVSSGEAEEIRENGQNSSGRASGSLNASSNAGEGIWMWDASVGRWWYCNPDKTYPCDSWQYINDFWYFFDGQGYMVTGWVLSQDLWYYCDSSGAMLTNTSTPDGYYVGADGAWQQ